MKKSIIAIVALLASASAWALDYEPEEGLTWQAEFGMNVSRIRGTVYDNTVGSYCRMANKAGLNVGVRAEYMLPECHGTYVSAALQWMQKGGAHKDSRTVIIDDMAYTKNGTHKINEHYVSLPIHVGYRFNINDDWGVYGEFGPYFAVGVTGNNKFSAEGDGTLVKNYLDYKEKTFRKNDNTLVAQGGLQRFDAGLGVRVGGEYANRYSLNLGMDWGMTDMLRDSYRNYYYDCLGRTASKLKNYCFSMTLGYRF